MSGGTTVYATPPALVFAGGTGSGAAGYATLNAAGNVNGVVITNPGSYTAAPTFNIAGFNGTYAQPTLAANSGGGLTKTGAGTLTLGGSNTYGGPTTVLNGTLQVGLPAAPFNAIAHYTLDGTAGSIASGATILDSAHGYNGTMGAAGASYVTGRFGQGINFTAATNEFVSVPYNAAFNVTSWTASAWIDLAALPANNAAYGILGTRNANDTFDMKYFNNAGTYQLHADIGNGAGTWYSTAANYNTTLSTNAWHQVAYAVNGSGYSIYLDGSLATTGTFSGTPPFMVSGQSLYIGNDYSTPEYMNGSIDDVSIYGSVLSAAQIQNLYTGQFGQLPATPASVASGAALDLNGVNRTLTSLADVAAGAGGTVTTSASAAVALTLTPNATTTFSGVIQNGNGLMSLTLNGAGTQVLAGGNTYTGATTITAGTLQLGNGGPTGSLAAASTITDNGTLAFNRGNTATQGVDFSGSAISGTGGLTQAGAGTLVLKAANIYTGATTISNGTLNVGSAENPGVSGPLGKQAANAAGSIVFGGGTLQYSASNQADYSGRFSTAANQPYNVDTNGQSVQWGTALTSSGGSLTKIGAGTLVLAASNTYTGSTTILGGTLKLQTPPAQSGLSYFKIAGDATSGISTANTYTQAINPSGGGFSVNGVPFTGAGVGTVTSLTAQSYTQPGTGTITISNSIGSSNFGATAIGTNLNGWSGVSGNMLTLYSHFNYNTAPLRTVVLSGLQPNTWYDVVLYEKQYDTSTGRTFSVGYDVGNTSNPQFTSPTIDQNQPQNTPALAALGIGQQNAWGMSYVYETGPGQTSIALNVTTAPLPRTISMESPTRWGRPAPAVIFCPPAPR